MKNKSNPFVGLQDDALTLRKVAVSFQVAKPRDYWKEPKNQKAFFEALGKKYQFKTFEDWYNLKIEDVRSNGGGPLLRRYFGNSLYQAVSLIYPDYSWNRWKFHFPPGYLSDKKHQRQFFEDLGKHKKIKNWEGWYKIKQSDAIDFGGSTILSYYRDSLSEALIKLFPEYPWQFWRFQVVQKNFWKNDDNIREYLKWLQSRLNIKDPQDWYSISDEIIIAFKGSTLLTRYKGLIPILKHFYPEYPWSRDERKSGVIRTQNWLFQNVTEIFPDAEDLFINYPHPEMKYSLTGRSMEFDIYIPSLKIAFEYQGGQHYGASLVPRTNEFSDIEKKDAEKKEACKKAEITLIEVPYWWDKSKESLIATINLYRPDLVGNKQNWEPIRR